MAGKSGIARDEPRRGLVRRKMKYRKTTKGTEPILHLSTQSTAAKKSAEQPVAPLLRLAVDETMVEDPTTTTVAAAVAATAAGTAATASLCSFSNSSSSSVASLNQQNSLHFYQLSDAPANFHLDMEIGSDMKNLHNNHLPSTSRQFENPPKALDGHACHSAAAVATVADDKAADTSADANPLPQTSFLSAPPPPPLDASDSSPSPHRDFHRSTPIRKNLIEKLMEIDRLGDLINLRGLKLRSAAQAAAERDSATQRLSHIGDEIVEHLVEWTKQLPFYNELPVEVHTHLLTQRWAELVLLSACFFSYYTSDDSSRSIVQNDIHCNSQSSSSPRTMYHYCASHNIPSSCHCNCNGSVDGNAAVAAASALRGASRVDARFNLQLLQARLSAVMAKHIPFEHVHKEAGQLVERFTELYHSFSQLRITIEAYVCLKVITILHYTPPTYESEEENAKSAKIHALYTRKVAQIQEQFVKALQIHLSQCEDGPRLSEILNWQLALRTASTVLLQSKMFYVPFLICKAPEALTTVAALAAVDEEAQRCDSAADDAYDIAVGADENPQNDETDCDESEEFSISDS